MHIRIYIYTFVNVNTKLCDYFIDDVCTVGFII